MYRRICSLLVITAACGSGSAVRGADFDTLHLRDDKIERGEITATSKTEVTIQAQTGTRREEKKVPVNEIMRVEWKAEPPALQLHRAAERSGQLRPALQGYRKVEAEVTDKNVKTDVAFLIARTLAKMGEADSAQLAEAAKALETFIGQNGNHFRYFPALAQLGDVYLNQKNYEQAQATFDKLGQAPWADYQMLAKVATGRLALAQEKYDAALAQFEAVAAMSANTPGETARRQQALLGKAAALRGQNQPAEATKVLDEVIDQAAAENTETLAEAYNLKGDSLQAEGKVKEALLAYLHVDVLFPGETSEHAKALYNIAQLWEKENRLDRAGDARAKLRDLYPNSREAQLAFGGGQ